MSFERVVARQVRSEWRRALIYAPAWKRTMLFCEVGKRSGRSQHFPTVRRVRGDGWRDRVSVRLLRGQCPAMFAAKADELAHSFGARSCRVRADRPRRVWLDFVHTDPLALPVPLPAIPAVVDVRRLIVGRTEAGQSWTLRLLGCHVLVAGVTGAGKSSLSWSLLWALAPAIRAGAVQVFALDPKGGMELGKVPAAFHRLV